MVYIQVVCLVNVFYWHGSFLVLCLMTSQKYGFCWSSLYNFGIDGVENTVSDSSSIVLGILAAVGMCLLSRCLAIGIYVALLWLYYFGFEVSLQYQ
jgi:hypothetical protein